MHMMTWHILGFKTPEVLHPARGQNLQPIFEQDDDEDPEYEQEATEHPRLRQTIQWDHSIDNILGSL